jgi:hypothetical protein
MLLGLFVVRREQTQAGHLGSICSEYGSSMEEVQTYADSGTAYVVHSTLHPRERVSNSLGDVR